MVSVPLAVSIQWDDEQIGPLQRFQDGRRPGATEHRVAQRAAQPIQYRGPHQKLPPVGRQSIEHLRGEKVDDVPVVATDRRSAPSSVRGTANGQCSQLEPHRPALGLVHEGVNRVRTDLDLAHRRDQAGGFRGAEPQIGGSDLGHFAAGPHSGKRQRRVEPGGNHQPERRRQIAQQVLEGFVDADVCQQVIVVQDQRVPGVARRQVVEQRGQRDLEGVDHKSRS